MAVAKPPRYQYRRNLPHMQNGVKPLFVSMATRAQLFLPPQARTLLLDHILREHDSRIMLYSAVVMPDHAHLLFSTLIDPEGLPNGMAEIMSSIRGSSAHSINKLLRRHGPLWEEEFFDRILRHDEFEQTMDYICMNPVRTGLVKTEQDYPWLWVNPLY